MCWCNYVDKSWRRWRRSKEIGQTLDLKSVLNLKFLHYNKFQRKTYQEITSNNEESDKDFVQSTDAYIVRNMFFVVTK